MRSSAAFSGMKLSEDTPSGGLDQRLFGSRSRSGGTAKKAEPIKTGDGTSPAAPTGSQPLSPPHIRQEDSGTERQSLPRITVNGKRVPEPQPAGAARWAELAFDINVKPYRKDSFLFTDDEFEAMEDLKLELKRTYDLPATKNDIARIALQRLFEDYARRGGASTIVSRLQGKKT